MGLTEFDKNLFYHVALLISILISIVLTLSFFYGPNPMNADSYTYVDYAHLVETRGFKELGGIMEVRYLLLGSIALFFRLFGMSALSSVMFEILCVAGTLISLYEIGTLLHGKRAGVLAAFLYSFFPLSILQAASIGDNVPMAFFASLSILFSILAVKKRLKIYYLLSGLVPVMGFLITPEEILIIIPVGILLLYDAFEEMMKRKLETAVRNLSFFFLGIAISLLIMALMGYALSGDFFHVYKVNSDWYTNYYAGDYPFFLNLDKYVSELMPYGTLLDYTHPNSTDLVAVGFGYYFYFAVAFGMLLLFAKDKRAIVPIIWISSTFLYLSFGTMSLIKYQPIMASFARILLIFSPALAIIIAFGIIRMFECAERAKNKREIFLLLACLASLSAVAILLITSVYMVRYESYAAYYLSYGMIQAGQFANSLPDGIQVSVPSLIFSVKVYADYGANFSDDTTCINDTYIVLPYIGNALPVLDGLNMSGCALTPVFVPETPAWLTDYATDFCCGPPDVAVYKERVVNGTMT
jgi:4-amino-4-deoxy-L-arabinose transferase-like glycosyltransferase